jgi:hypothetical protein
MTPSPGPAALTIATTARARHGREDRTDGQDGHLRAGRLLTSQPTIQEARGATGVTLRPREVQCAIEASTPIRRRETPCSPPATSSMSIHSCSELPGFWRNHIAECGAPASRPSPRPQQRPNPRSQRRRGRIPRASFRGLSPDCRRVILIDDSQRGPANRSRTRRRPRPRTLEP